MYLENAIGDISELNIPNDVYFLCNIFQKKKYSTFLVGGCVRDLIMKKTPHDWDICTAAKPDEILNLLKEFNISFHTEGIKYGTVLANINSREYEITTFRGEAEYKDDETVFIPDIVGDLKRRDFTINAMAYNPHTWQFIDLYGGKEDIKNKIIRAVGDANKRLSEDGLRILRALRFSVKYGFEIEEDTKSAMLKNIDLLDSISKERITAELEKMLTCGEPISQKFIEYHDLIFKIIPELKTGYLYEQCNKFHLHNVYEHNLYVTDYCKTNDFAIKLAGLLHDVGKPATASINEKGELHFYSHPEASYEISKDILNNDLRLNKVNQQKVLNLVRYHDYILSNTKPAVRRFISKHGIDFTYDWFILKQADLDDHIYPIEDKFTLDWYIDIPGIKETLKLIKQEEMVLKVTDLNITGKDIMSYLKIKPCKLVGYVLNDLLYKVTEEMIKNDANSLIQEVENIKEALVQGVENAIDNGYEFNEKNFEQYEFYKILTDLPV